MISANLATSSSKPEESENCDSGIEDDEEGIVHKAAEDFVKQPNISLARRRGSIWNVFNRKSKKEKQSGPLKVDSGKNKKFSWQAHREKSHQM